MSNAKVRSIPEGMHSLTPHLVCDDATAAIEYYKEALGAVEISQLRAPDGTLLHAAVKIGDSTLFLVDDMPQDGVLGPKALKGSPVIIHLYVENADATVRRAVAAGGEVTLPLWDEPWGDRYGQFRDPFGHIWSVATHVRDVTPQELQQAICDIAA